MTPPWKQRMDALQLKDLAEIFGTPKPIIGMVHCWPLPGAPGYTGYGMPTIIDNALRDAHALAEGGVDGIIVENMWDIPFRAGPHIQPESIASHAVVAAAVKRELPQLPMGINLVHNGGVSLLGIALASGAEFIRVCMFTGAGVWDAGEIDEGCAADLMRRRKDLHAEHIKIFADVDKKHSVRFPGIDLATHIEWTRFFGADALIISGRMTGDAPNLQKVREAKAMAGDRPVLLGSGTSESNIAAFMEVADGTIVGSSIKDDGVCENPVSLARVKAFVSAARGKA
ncbi:BtpA/SgcQ family protein [Chloroflexia bacterium SDU3-3]|nr:BtpA/SgcQ family protein [Chloroflexia bacterium SDU3-3]